MSSLIVEVCRIESVKPHPNADRLELATIKGWQAVVPKGQYAPGTPVVYIPPDSVLPVELSDRLGVTKYLSSGRVRCAKLRGEPSFGIVMPAEASMGVGADVTEQLGITKYIPPLRTSVSDALPDHPMFARYTEIENMRNFPDVIHDGEEVIATEKIHGTSCRVGLIEGVPMAGSKSLRRKKPELDRMETDLYWHPWSLDQVHDLMLDFQDVRHVMLFGEVYGKVQSLRYGLGNGIAFRAFDIMVDGHYLDYEAFLTVCIANGVQTVPPVYRGPYSIEKIREISDGPSLIEGADHHREGVVVRPVKERHDPKVGRVILKYVSDTYLFGDQSDTDDQ
jgi:RNA ligase (TIGR02306 family)